MARQPSDCVPGATFEHAVGAEMGQRNSRVRQIRLKPKNNLLRALEDSRCHPTS
jgi:hypothetical protein